MGMGIGNRFAREQETKHFEEEDDEIKKEEEERSMAAAMTSGNWRFSLNKPKVSVLPFQVKMCYLLCNRSNIPPCSLCY